MKLEVPHTFDDITLRMIQRHGDREIEPIEKVQIYTGISTEDINKMPYQLIQKGAEHIDMLLANPLKRFQKVIEVDGVLHGFIPDWSKFTTGEYIDMESRCKNLLLNAQHIMAIVYRPISRQFKDTYTIEPYEGTTGKSDKFADISASHFYGTLLFFSITRKEYMNHSLKSLVEVVRENQLKPNSAKNGRGITSFRHWRKKILRKSIKSQSYL
jgi:hypothetical protein